ncbi:tetratricopeptide repeat protein [Pelagibacteraceae bacterium]|nr:tetratricopeptide repeat protein [Pelagibacteraceae bacterium]
MKKKNITTKETLILAHQKHRENKFEDSEKLYTEIINKEPEHLEANFGLGLLFLRIKNINKIYKAKSQFEKTIKINPNYAASYNNLGQIFLVLGENKKAAKYFEKTIELQPDLAAPYNNLGNILLDFGENKKALKCFEKAIQIQPGLIAAHNNLGTVLGLMKEYKKAIECFKKAIELNYKNPMSHYNLGKAYKDSKNYPEAIKCFIAANTTRSRAEMLESSYFSLGLNGYKKILEDLSRRDPLNLRVATMAAYVSKKEKINNIYPFCKNPLDYVFVKNIKNEIESSDEFLSSLSLSLSKFELTWQPTTKSTKNGYHTSGNLFNNNQKTLVQLKEIIKKQINLYKNNYKFSKDYFITKWPNENEIEAWHVRLRKEGYQKSHIHPAGWLSGCFYLKIPKALKDNQGAIKFTFTGYDYPEDKTLETLIHKPKVFDIALFPSSLFHQTIPFSSQEERHVIAFDLMPK